MPNSFEIFLSKFKESFKSKQGIINTVLANVFSMRVIGNKTHGDLAEIALTEYINDFVDGYEAKHTGKEAFRAKSKEEDITVINKENNVVMKISIKTYGFGPLQLSTNKECTMFPHLKRVIGEKGTSDLRKIRKVLGHECFVNFNDMNIIPLIYNEKTKRFKIIIFNAKKAYRAVRKIDFSPPRKLGKKKTFPIYKFFGHNGQYIFEVRYGDAKANALQRGMWTHTENAKPFFNEILKGSYVINKPLINLISRILVSTEEEHTKVLSSYFKKI